MKSPTVEIKDRLRKAINDRDISQQELAELTGIPKSSISQYVSGYAKPKQDRIYLLAKALRVNEAWLLGYDSEMDIADDEPKINKEYVPDVIAAHFDGKQFSEEDIEVINRFIEFVSGNK